MKPPRGWKTMLVFIPLFIGIFYGMINYGISHICIHQYLDANEMRYVTNWEVLTYQKVPYSEIKKRMRAERQREDDYHNGVNQ